MAAFYAQARAAVAPPLLLHGRRRIKKGMVNKFRANFDAYSKAAFAIPGIKAVFAFADREEPLALRRRRDHELLHENGRIRRGNAIGKARSRASSCGRPSLFWSATSLAVGPRTRQRQKSSTRGALQVWKGLDR